MHTFLFTSIGRLRAIGFIEGISYLALLGIAMPMKYVGGNPAAVSVVGAIHGVLWIAFVAVLLEVRSRHGWSMKRSFWALVSSVVPFGTFVLDTHLRAEQDGTTVAMGTG